MDVVVWLRSLGLGKYEATFRENEIDETVLPNLTAEDLKDLGVEASSGTAVKFSTLLSPCALMRARRRRQPPLSFLKLAPIAEDRAERRQVTVMFSDLVGSDGPFSPHGPRRPPRGHFGLSGVRRGDHTSLRWLHCAVTWATGPLVYFGYPQAHEDDAERAVRAGLELVAAVSDLKTHAAYRHRPVSALPPASSWLAT